MGKRAGWWEVLSRLQVAETWMRKQVLISMARQHLQLENGFHSAKPSIPQQWSFADCTQPVSHIAAASRNTIHKLQTLDPTP